ncbi:serine/threonine-protein kinase [Streptomyces sp. NRRL F-5650]|uniref:serine/threonine-protein kinase n=1 Tax=Streptomyces sp. NRRL F-5650 TaxID=1463868 RepID=UPI00068EFF2C|nr:serine/threonine-protein kinase [Streptomyces sp. NRRL F-5650]
MTQPLGAHDPREIGPYQLLHRLGRGGMGQVFLGRSPGGRLVAVKLVHPELASNTEFRRRFAQEVAAARKVGGFYTAQVVDADPEGDPPWLVTAYIPGPSLHQVVVEQGALKGTALRVLGSGLAEGLAAVHAAGLVHRDLKPANVIVADDGPRVIDFGIARALEGTSGTTQLTQSAIGTPGYMSPEQARGLATGPESDVFALGCVLAFAATGHAPYGKGRPEVVLYRTIHEDPDLAGVPSDLAPFIERCLAADPAERPTLAAVLDRLATSADDTRWLPESVNAMIEERRAATLLLPPEAERTAGRSEGLRSARRTLTRPQRYTAAAAAGVLAAAGVVWGVTAWPDAPGSGSGSDKPSSSSATGTANAAATSGRPCDIIDNSVIRQFDLTDTGTAGGYTRGSAEVRTCTWASAKWGVDVDFSFTLAYAPKPVDMFVTATKPDEDLPLEGLPEAIIAADADTSSCEIAWRKPTKDGGAYATVLAKMPTRGMGQCPVAEEFAQVVQKVLRGEEHEWLFS